MLLRGFYSLIGGLVLLHDEIGALARYAPGPAFPPISFRADDPAIFRLQAEFDAVFDQVVHSASEELGCKSTRDSIALQLTSMDETIWSSYHTPSDTLNSIVTVVNGSTVFRIASISKTFTVYALLLEPSIDLDRAITSYIPELLDPEDERGSIPWDQISLRSLASQLSGIPRDSRPSLNHNRMTEVLTKPHAAGGNCFVWREVLDEEHVRDNLTNHGFPPLNVSNSKPDQRPCQLSDLVSSARKARMVFRPNKRPTYSNIAFSLLGAVVERATGTSYSAAISDKILKPLGMKDTSTARPADSSAAIPAMDNDWSKDLGADIPTAGMYSTADDLSLYLRSILKAELLPEHTVNAWLKPSSWTDSGTGTAYGMPWEIFRSTRLLPDGRPVEIFSKDGALKGYHSTILLIPEFEVALTILVAGETRCMVQLRERLVGSLVPAVDRILRESVQQRYSGQYMRYSLDDSQLPDPSSQLELAVDEAGPGLIIKKWTANGIDFLDTYGYLQGQLHNSWNARLLPCGVESQDPRVETWRIVIVDTLDSPSQEEALWSDYSLTDVDDLVYGGKAVGEFLFTMNSDGHVSKIHSVGLRTDLYPSWSLVAESASVKVEL